MSVHTRHDIKISENSGSTEEFITKAHEISCACTQGGLHLDFNALRSSYF